MITRNSHTQSLFKPLTAAVFTSWLLVGCSADEGPAGINIPGATTVLTIGQFAATPDTVAPGGSTTLSYTSTGAASCTASSNAPGSSWMGSQPTSGSFVVTVPQTPGDYTYTLTCASATGEQTSQSETVTVPAPAGAPPVINDLTAAPASVAPGGTTELSYTTTGAVRCEANSSAPNSTWTGPQPTSSTATAVVLPVTPGSYTYALTCTNADGQQTTDFETVTVTGGPLDPGAIEPNDGTTPTTVIDDDGTETPGFFVCTAGARTYGPNPATEVRVNGLVGSQLTDLLDLLGAGTVTQLQNSVVAKELVVDLDLGTAAQYNLSVGLLGGAISSIDLAVGLNSPAPTEKFAVFLVSFPAAAVEASLVQSVTVTTRLNGTVQDVQEIDASTLDLAGQVQTGESLRFVGLKATLPYDEATISLSPMLISANVGNAMNVHELCTDGFFINAPAP